MAPRPDDVFRKPWDWRSVDRDEACFLCRRARVVVVFRPGGATTAAEWLTPRSAWYSPHAPYTFRSLSYFVYEAEEEEASQSAPQPDKGGLAAPPPDDEAANEIPAADLPSDRPDKQEEEERDTIPEAEPVATAGALTRAAQTGVPFCEICAKTASGS